MGATQMKREGKSSKGSIPIRARASHDVEARWRGELSESERGDVRAWVKKLSVWARCDLRIGKERSRLTMAFDRSKLEESSRERIGVVERMLSAQEEPETREGAVELAALRQAPIESAEGLLVKDYVELLARDWAAQTSASFQAMVPSRCALRVTLRGAPSAPVAGQANSPGG